MKVTRIFLQLVITLTFFGCYDNISDQRINSIPNGDFEQWDNLNYPTNWTTNSCPACVPPYETYIVQKTTDAAHGQFAAKFICNGVYRSFAKNKFTISYHPTALNAYLKSGVANGDTATIHIDVFLGKNVVDSGNWYETNTSSVFKNVNVQISKNNSKADSVLITIIGGHIQNTTFIVDNMTFVKPQ